ncbi:multidrug transporter [Mucilaginibacter xinganensis]|uniref:Multidrug transporter n=2 Tax=Mucilaginibacter xinganensis TaxID=1234841 RepID=A0A223NZY0_9SPHI|nr:multidrug transporter [Mucilaginibacter xinganensis]
MLGWLCFAIASTTYVLTLEPSVSFWDCGEFISCAYRLQVSHQPGYPLFAMLGKAFSLLSFGNNAKVPYFTNLMSALASGATIMFLFWTITALAKKLLNSKDGSAEGQQLYLIMGAGLVGALAFTYTDTFWFSAVETIVFALSSLCTAVVFWAILKWDAHADEAGADKWIVLIAYIVGLSIGIHLLNLLTIPAVAMVYYFRRYNNITLKSGLMAFLISIVILGLVQFGIRGYTIYFAAWADLFFVNTLGLGFGSGAAVFCLLLAGAIAAGIWYSIRSKKPMLNMVLLCLAFIYFGYSSFVYIPIRATANTDLNNSHPDNAFTLYSYLNRIQYGETPLLTGPYFDAKIIDQKDGGVIYQKGKTRYESAGRKSDYVYDHNTFLPRMWSTESDPYYAQNVQFYKQWLQLADGQSPTFADNMKWMFSWQMYQMYFRYFLWNFVGRYNEMGGQQSTEDLNGNWTSGIFDGSKHLPKSIKQGTNYAPLYALPFVLGLLGAAYHFKRKKRDALVIALLFFFTGIAIVLYVNQNSLQPRERDYSYVGSFYAFAIWIGLGVIALAEIARLKLNAKFAAIGSFAICMLAVPVLLAFKEWKGHDRSTKMIAHDMAYNFLISCPKNAILFTYGDNDTYSLWYDQEVEGIRPDVRIVCLSLFSGDWYIHQMQKKMNQSAPLPITLNFDKYKAGTRDVIYFNDAKIPGSVEVKDVFDFITSDDSRTKISYQSGDVLNYLPTKNFKLTINPDEVVKKGVVTPQQKDKLAGAMEWKFAGNYVTKDNLAMIDIMAHNNWDRPICFTTTMGPDNMFGLQPYLYKEGFVYHLIPFKNDTASAGFTKTNSLVMYDNVVNKFKFGNYKKAKYLDDVSLTQFYLTMEFTFSDLAQGLIKDGHRDLALNAIHKFDEQMPDINPDIDTATHKFFLAETAYNLGDKTLATKYVKGVAGFISDQLDYNYNLLKDNKPNIDHRTVQLGIQLLNSMADTTRDNNEMELSKQLQAQLKDYGKKFAVLMR